MHDVAQFHVGGHTGDDIGLAAGFLDAVGNMVALAHPLTDHNNNFFSHFRYTPSLCCWLLFCAYCRWCFYAFFIFIMAAWTWMVTKASSEWSKVIP